MSTDEKKLTVNDPISEQTLTRLAELGSNRAALSEQYVDYDNEKIRLQVAIRQIDQEKQKLFEKELMDRGIAPSTPVEIDAKTGAITVLTPPKSAG